MARKLATDKVLFVPLVALSLFGCVMIYSASAVSSAQTSGSPYRYLVKQIAALAVGGLGALLVSRVDYRVFARPWVVYLAYGGAFALCVLALLQPPINSARRWIPVGPVMFQPSEFLKVALVVLLEPDLGTAACYVMLGSVLLWIAGVRAKLFLLLGAGALPLVIAAAFAASYRRARVLSFLRPEADPLGAGFQALQSLIAVGAGGLFGNGLGASRQKLFFLPYPHTDFIFAIVGEELGFIGSVGVIACFAVIAWRGFRAARRAPDAFGGLLAAGATAMLVVQAAVNVSVVLAIMPTKGIPLPFVSYGGSSLVASWLAAGLILNVSQHEVGTRET